MRQFLFLTALLIGFMGFSQEENEQFKKQFRYVSFYKNGEWGETSEGTNTFVFNVGENRDVILYMASGKKQKYTRVSKIKENKTKDGVEVQYVILLDEEGDELILFLYKNGILKLVYNEDLQIQFNP